MCATKFGEPEDIFKATLEYVWKIRNHPEVVTSANLLKEAKQYFDFVSNTGQTYKWEVGYKLCYNKKSFMPYLRIVSSVAEGKLSCTKSSLWHNFEGKRAWEMLATNEYEKPQDVYMQPEIYFPDMQWPLGHAFYTEDFDLTMWLKVVVYLKVDNSVNLAEMHFRTVSLANLQKNLALLLDDSDTADLKIICSDGVELFAHQTILHAQNPVFASMLTSDMRERSSGILRIDDVSSSTMKILLEHLYTAEIPEKWNNPENFVEMTYASGKYQLTDFQILLDTVLGKQDHGESNFKLLELANKLFLKNAEARLLQRFKDTINGVTNADEFLEIIKNFKN